MANTPNIDLVKPAGTDHALVSVLNSNSDKIDSFAGTTNQAIVALKSSWGPVAGDAEKGWITGANLNDYKTNGIYPIGSSPTNAPAAWGILTVYALRQDTIYQTYECQGIYFIRELRNGWGNWSKLVTSDNTLQIAEVSGTMSSTLDTFVSVSYPTGYNQDNSYIIGYNTKHTYNGWYSNLKEVTAIGSNQGIRIKTTDSNFLSSEFKILLGKFF